MISTTRVNRNYVNMNLGIRFLICNLGRAKLDFLLIVGLLAAICSVNVAAQTLEEIIVTATRRSESVLDVPYNISVVGSDMLEHTGAVGLGDLSRLIPGITFVDQGLVARGNNSNLALRGLNTADATNGRSQPSASVALVSTYFGETPIFFPLTLKDMSRVEVLRGPQGTLYGNSSMGGTIRFIPKKPDLESGFKLDVSGDFGFIEESDEMSYSTDIIANIPVNDNFGLRVAGGYIDVGGFIDGIRPVTNAQGAAIPSVAGDLFSGFVQGPLQEDINDSDKWWVRGSALWNVNDIITATVTYQHEDSQQDNQQMTADQGFSGNVDPTRLRPIGAVFDQAEGCTGVPGAQGFNFFGFVPVACNGPGGNTAYPNGTSTIPAALDYQNFIPVEENYESTVDVVNLNLDVELESAIITSATSYSEINEDYVLDSTGFLEMPQLPNANALVNEAYGLWPRAIIRDFRDTKIENISQELRLASDWDNMRWDYVVGFYYQEVKTFTDDVGKWPGATEHMAAFGNAFAGFPFTSANPGFEIGDFFATTNTKFEDVAVFGEFTYRVSEQWQITGGIRSFWQDISYSLFQQLPACGAGCGDPALPAALANLGTVVVSDTQSTSDQLFKINTSYDFNDDMMGYLTWSEGFRRGGVNGTGLVGNRASLPELRTFSPDFVENFEAGIKGRLSDRVQYSFAGYHIKWNNFQFDGFTANGFDFVGNGEDAESTGLELEVHAQVNDQFSVDFGYTYTDAEVTKDFTVLDLQNGIGTAIVPIADVKSGSKLPNAPEHTITLNLDYEQPNVLPWGSLRWNLNSAFRDDTVSDLDSSSGQFFEMDSFWIWNASVALISDKNWSANAYIRNIGNEEGITGGLPPSMAGRSHGFLVSQPRTIGFGMSYSFY